MNSLNQFQTEVGNFLVPLGFSRLKNPPKPDGCETELRNDSVVWGTIVPTNRNPAVCLRVYALQNNPLLLLFVVRNPKGVSKVGSERLTDLNKLTGTLNEWRRQLSEVDIACNKCDGGWYELGRKGDEPKLVICNRCAGKGWQNYNDRRANEAYDWYMRTRQEQYDIHNTEDGLLLKPHWVPYNGEKAPQPKRKQ